MSSSEHCRRAIFQIYNVQNLKITRITTFRIYNVVYQAGSRWDPKCIFNVLRFFERTLYKSDYIIFILSWCGTHTKIRSKLVDIVTAGSQKITLSGPQRTPLGILRVKVSQDSSILKLWTVFVSQLLGYSLLFRNVLFAMWVGDWPFVSHWPWRSFIANFDPLSQTCEEGLLTSSCPDHILITNFVALIIIYS